MITYQDFLAADDKEKFIVSAIASYRRSKAYQTALDANEYEAQRNVTIVQNVRKIYDITGVAAPDPISANNRIPSNFFHRLNNDRCSYSLGNGISFPDGANKKALGDDFDTVLYDAAYSALIHGVSYIYVSDDEYVVFPMTEFLPLPDEKNGKIRAGVRFWSLDWRRRPGYCTLYEEDGYTVYRSKDGKAGLGQLELVKEKTAYKVTVRQSNADGEEVVSEENYGELPIAPVYASRTKESTLVGMRANIDAYDMIHSGFANDLQDCAQVYWLISNAMGMDDNDVAKLRDRLLFQHMAVVDTSDGASLNGYTHEIPYAARKECLDSIRSRLYEDFAVLDVHTISAGATNDHIDAGYQPMDEEADRFEYFIIKAVQQIETIKGLEPLVPIFKRNKISNQQEQTEMVLSALDIIGRRTALTKIPWITVDEVDDIMRENDREEGRRITNEEPDETGINEQEIIDTAEEVAGKTLNGAQTQSLISVVAQYTAGSLSEGQAASIIAVAIGVTKREALSIIRGEI